MTKHWQEIKVGILVGIVLQLVLIKAAMAGSPYQLATGQVSVFVFEEDISFFNVSIAADYIATKQHENKLMVTAMYEFEGAKLLVESGGVFHQLNLVYTPIANQANLFVDCREKQASNFDTRYEKAGEAGGTFRYVEGKEGIVDAVVLSRVESNLASFFEGSIPGKKVGVRQENFGVSVAFEKAFADEDHLYFKLALSNNTSLVYDLAYVRCSYETVQKEMLFKPDVKYKVEVSPTTTCGDVDHVEAYSKASYCIAVPIFALEKKGDFLITIKEKNGMRDVVLEVEPKRLSSLSYERG